MPENSSQWKNQGEHTYETDDHFNEVRTVIAKVSSNTTQDWAENAFHKRIFFDDKDYYRVWSFNYNNFGDGADYSDQKDYFIEAKIGDDYLQKQAYGRTAPETFNHGTSAQRSRWLKKGLATGDVSQGDTFSPAYSAL